MDNSHQQQSASSGSRVARSALTIEVWFDFICPWCLIGKRQLQLALRELHQTRPEVVVQVQWHGMSLLPDLPHDGCALCGVLPASARQRCRRAAAPATGRGGCGDGRSRDQFSSIQRMPNTALAHHTFRHLQATEPAERLDAVLESWFRLHFIDGGNLGDAASLARCAKASGVPADHLPQGAAPGAFHAAGPANGVPAFRINGRYQLAGAVPPAQLLSTMTTALDEGTDAGIPDRAGPTAAGRRP